MSQKLGFISVNILFFCSYLAYGQIDADFEVEYESQCPPGILKFINKSKDFSTCKWVFGNGNVSTSLGDTLRETYPDPGNYTVTLTVTDGVTIKEQTKSIKIFKGPEARFTTNLTKGCIPMGVQFSQTAIAGDATISGYFWDFRDGTTSVVKNPDKLYTRIGEYTILFRVDDTNGCSHFIDRADYIQSFAQPQVVFQMSPEIACTNPVDVSFTNTTKSDLGLSYTWTFGDGQTSSMVNPEHTFSNQGEYLINLKAFNNMGCGGEASRRLSVSDDIESNFAMIAAGGVLLKDGDSICGGMITFRNISTIKGGAHWFVNGSYAGGVDSAVNAKWKAGVNVIQLRPKVTGGCLNLVEKRLFLNSVEAGFETSDISCSFPLRVNFTNMSYNATTFKWELAQGNSSTEENPQLDIESIYGRKDYIRRGTDYYYLNKLIATNDAGCIDSVSLEMYFDHPEAELTANDFHGCVPLNIAFEHVARGKSIPDSIISKQWLFGDGGVSNTYEDSVKYTYTVGGDYQARLVIENDIGCRDTSAPFAVNAGDKLLPDFEFSPKAVCYNDSITFMDNTPNSELIDYWRYQSDANIYSECELEPNPKLGIEARSTGFKDVSLEVEYNGCVSSSTQKNALYIRGPVASFTHTIDCSNPLDINFESKIDLGSSFEWDFDDGTNETVNPNLVHRFTNGGDYRVKLMVVNDTTGCSFEIGNLVVAHQVHAEFDCDTIACVGESLLINPIKSSNYGLDCNFEGFVWDFDEGEAPFRTFRYERYKTFFERGTYNVKLVAIDANGCQDTTVRRVSVYEPEPHFITDTNSGCSPDLKVKFTNISTDTTITRFVWNFGDGDSLANVDEIVHSYTSENDNFFRPTLVAYDRYGCSTFEIKTISMYSPNASFEAIDRAVCAGATVPFETVYVNPDSSQWKIGDHPYINTNNQYTFDSAGVFTVKHRIFKDNCVDSFQITNYIAVEKAMADILASDTVTECYPQTIRFDHINKESSIVEGRWDFDFKGHQSPGYIDSVYFSYSLPGVFYPELTVKTSFGCEAVERIRITVNGPYAELVVSDSKPCKFQGVDFGMTNVKDVAEQSWTFGDGTTSKGVSPTHIYETFNKFIASLVIKDALGCTPPAIYDTIYIKEVRSVFALAENDTSLCVYEILDLENNSTGGQNYAWSVRNVNLSDVYLPLDISFPEPGEYSLFLEISDSENCTDTSSRKIMVYPLPLVEVSASDSICRNVEEAELYALTDSVNQVEWLPEIWVDNVNNLSTNAAPEVTTRFYAKVTDTIGCVQYDSALVFVQQFPTISRLPVGDTTILLGEVINLSIQSDYLSQFTWDVNDSLHTSFIDSIFLQPQESSVIRVNIKDNCFEISEEYQVNVREIYTIELPEVFTPNNDGVNDRVYVRGGGIQELLEFKVFNRYGNLVYFSDDINEGWDGYYKGKLQNSDVYTYFVRVLTFAEEIVVKNGSFNLVY